MRQNAVTQTISLVMMILSLAACSTSTIIDEYRETNLDLELNGTEQVVIMGRRHAGEYETEPDFIDCIGHRLANGGKVSVMPEQQFLDSFYPWFEPRVAPLKLKRMSMILNDPIISERINSLSIRYLIWVDGSTETTEKSGSVNCALALGGGGCFGFTTWDKSANYEATIWDLKQLDEEGRVKVRTEGSSYVLAVIAPIPFIAQVQADACGGIGDRLKSFFSHTLPGS
tara:strand:+ start:1842 stop:2525 length:684 start_codon:yes stop_codon:yes gene_type:complete